MNMEVTTISASLMGYWVYYPEGIKWTKCKADPSPPSTAKVKNGCSYTSTPPYVFMTWGLIKHMIHLLA